MTVPMACLMTRWSWPTWSKSEMDCSDGLLVHPDVSQERLGNVTRILRDPGILRDPVMNESKSCTRVQQASWNKNKGRNDIAVLASWLQCVSCLM